MFRLDSPKFLPLVFILAAGCASTSKPGSEIQGRRTTVLAVPEVRAVYKEPDLAIEQVVQIPADEVTYSVKRSLVQLEIPITIDDAKSGAVGNNDFMKVYRIAEIPMMQFLDCGVSANGARTSTHRMFMSFVAYIEPVNQRSTRIKMVLSANAQDPANTNSRIPCGSTGKLERMVLDGVRGKVDGK